MSTESEDLGMDQEGASASPPLINDKNHGRAAKLLEAAISIHVKIMEKYDDVFLWLAR